MTLLLTPVASEGTKPSNTMGVERRKATGEVFLTNQIVSLSEAKVMDLLPTPRAQHGEDRNQRIWARPADQPQNLENALALLPTPRTSDTNGPGHHGTGGMDLRTSVTLLPTPAACVANDGETPETWNARREQVKAKGINGNGMGKPLTIAAMELAPTHIGPVEDCEACGCPEDMHDGGGFCCSGKHDGNLYGCYGREVYPDDPPMLPTPRATRGGSGTETMYLLGAERTDDDRPQGEVVMQAAIAWGPYEPAIRRWEAVLGRPAPAPTEPNAKGNHRLSPRFCEWMMGAPDGWICDIEGISRSDKLKAAGNGVVRQQAAAALKDMLAAFATQEAVDDDPEVLDGQLTIDDALGEP